MKIKLVSIIILMLTFGQINSYCQSPKLTREEKKQERKDIDSLLVVKSLPLSITLTNGSFQTQIRDSLIQVFTSRNYKCLNEAAANTMIKENMFSFMPSVVTEREKYLEVMEKVQRDKSYYFTLMELADPFLQSITLSLESDTTGVVLVRVKRQNFPNGRKSREWIFMYEESEPVNNLALRIIEAVANTKQSQ